MPDVSSLKSQLSPPFSWTRWALPALLLVHFLLRCTMAHSPFFAETYYDEAVTGNMALHVLKGEPQVFFWGQPYMGALEAYLASTLFLLVGPSAFTLHLTDIIICAVLLLTAFRIGVLVGGRSVGLLAAVFWAFSPLYLSVIGLLATGGHEEACALGALALFGICRLGFGSPTSPGLLAALVGLLGGLGYWSSLLAGPYLLAGGLGLVLGRPRLLLTRIPWVGLGGFFLGSLPFWLWQWGHDFSTFHFFESQRVGLLCHWWGRVYTVLRESLFQSFLGDWWDGHSVLPKMPAPLPWTVFVVFYLPPFLLTFRIMGRWVRRILSRQRPFQGPIDPLTALFWILVLSFSSGAQGSNGTLRYTLTFYLPFSIFLAVWLNNIWAFRRVWGQGALIAMIGFNLLLHFLFLREFHDYPYRPVDALMRALEERSLHYAYADNRIAQPLTFESRGRIVCADYFGQRNYDYLRAVDRAPAREVAIITHRQLGHPLPEVMEASLQMAGGRYESFEQGDYVVFHHFQEPSTPLRPLLAKDLIITASQKAEDIFFMQDRDVLTAWEVPAKPGEWVQVDLGRIRTLGRVSFLPGGGESDEDCQIRLEVSRDGKNWDRLTQDRYALAGLVWVGGRPRLDDRPRVQINFSPRLARYLRLTNLLPTDDPNQTFSILELFVYEAAEAPVPPDPEALRSLALANQALEHWMDEPTGPHPLFPGANLAFRKRQVDWPETVGRVQAVLRLAPDWEEPQQVFRKAVSYGDLARTAKKANKKKEVNYDLLFPPGNLRRIPAKSFKAAANFNTRETGLAFDGDYATRWGSLKNQEPGMVFQVDLGEVQPVGGFSLFLNEAIFDFPRGLKILVSPDGAAWREIRPAAAAEYAFSQKRLFKKNTYRFPVEMIRYIKLVQTGADRVFWWSIFELEVMGLQNAN